MFFILKGRDFQRRTVSKGWVLHQKGFPSSCLCIYYILFLLFVVFFLLLLFRVLMIIIYLFYHYEYDFDRTAEKLEILLQNYKVCSPSFRSYWVLWPWFFWPLLQTFKVKKLGGLITDPPPTSPTPLSKEEKKWEKK